LPTAYPTLPEDYIRREIGKAFTDWVEDPSLKIQLLLRGEKVVNKALLAGPRTAGRALSHQALQNEHQDILGEPITPHTR
jgi:hypothetical protein